MTSDYPPHEPVAGPVRPDREVHLARARRAAWPLCATTLLLTVVAVGLAAANGGTHNDVTHLFLVVTSAVVGATIAAQRPEHPIGWLALTSGFCFALQEACGQYAAHGLVVAPGSLPWATALAWPQNWLWVPGNAAMALIPVFFPDGRPLSARWRPAVWAVVLTGAVAMFTGALRPGANEQVSPAGAVNPLGLAGWQPVADLTAAVATLTSAVVFLAAGGAVVWQARRARGVRREQVRWFGYAVALSVAVVAARLVAGLTDGRPGVFPYGSVFWDLAGGISAALIPIAIGIAIRQHRLFDIDLLISRTVVFVALSTGVGGVYVLVVGLLGAGFDSSASLPVSFVGAAVAALLVAPLRHWLQRRVNLLVYGERDDPYAVLARLGERLEQTPDAAAVLATSTRTVREALQLSYVEIATVDGRSYRLGVPPAEPVRLPLSAGEPVGHLLLGPRAGESTLGARELRLLRDLARHIGVAVQAVRALDRAQSLAADLQRSREQLVLAREEERRRLRRDLHDGLGPTLAGLTMRAEAAQEIGPGESARRLLEEIVVDARTAVADVRRLVNGLRPPALDTMDLTGALRSHIAAGPADGPRVRFDAPATLPALSAAAEVAAYRIAVEALNNARRHAHADTIELRLRVDGGMLHLQVRDDGRGREPGRPDGVGMHSMRERAEELGGSCVVTSTPNAGTRVTATLLTGTKEDDGADPRAAG
ncbi:sensor histidine kinase [Micromonospora radicis]|uniref:histidine kinase n=1 Tax=Micromonospora radicis TaxID=1894971 RepID=A0A418N060_9ACTN|nr:sensor histidine kinase [Micromonospora radicis]RIV41180.1 sensor histidine kinase [Micromonospora radicis]